MAYHVDITCDECCNSISWVNHTVPISRAQEIARQNGWRVGKTGWICPQCRARRRMPQWRKREHD